MTIQTEGYTITAGRDDRGRIVVEVFHNKSGKTLGITEVDNFEMARHWGSQLINSQSPK